jgi:cytochrome c oxidase subunit II
MTVDVIGHQWWWEIRYPGTTAVTANEIHVPVNTRVNVVATTADVIHGFWVPALNRKIDMIPGLHNRVLLYSSQVGKHRGQCSQFCGLQHARMSLWVFVQTPAAYRAWLRHMAAPSAPPTGSSCCGG